MTEKEALWFAGETHIVALLSNITAHPHKIPEFALF